MLIEIKRKHTNDLYSEGLLCINDMRTTHTVESTTNMLPVGIYQLKIIKKSARKQYISIIRMGHTTGWKIGIGSSWKSSEKNSLIAIGERLIPGALYKATPIYERLIDRLMKCESRGEGIQLVISDDHCILGKPIGYWIEPNNHGCPPSNREVLRIDDRTYEIYDGPKHIKTIVLPEKDTQA